MSYINDIEGACVLMVSFECLTWHMSSVRSPIWFMNLFKFFPNKNLKWYFKLFLKLQEYISILTVWKENGLKLDNSENFNDKAFFYKGYQFCFIASRDLQKWSLPATGATRTE